MRGHRTGAAVVITLVLAVVGAASAYVLASDDDPEPTVPSSTTTPVDPAEQAADQLAAALGTGLSVPLQPDEAECLATTVLRALGGEALLELSAAADPVAAMSTAQHDRLVQAVVDCVPEAIAAELFGTAPGSGGSLDPLELES